MCGLRVPWLVLTQGSRISWSSVGHSLGSRIRNFLTNISIRKEYRQYIFSLKYVFLILRSSACQMAGPWSHVVEERAKTHMTMVGL